MWVLMIAGFAITSLTVSRFLDPFSARRLVQVVCVAAGGAFLMALCAVWGVESTAPAMAIRGGPRNSFSVALGAVWRDDQARRFTWFVFVSMLAYSAQELLLEPFAGLVFGYTLGQSAKLAGLWHAAVFFGMVGVGILGSGARRYGSLRAWTIGGCCASAVAILSLAAAALVGPVWPIKPSVMLLGVANGVFAVSAIGSMMELAHRRPDSENARGVLESRHDAGDAGVRMGLWGAAQAVAFALGGVFGTGTVDLIRYASGSPVLAFAMVFGLQAMLFFIAARFAARVGSINPRRTAANSTAVIA
jgi:BCD family chlorophyll transporter-like MFS transporter